MMMTTFYRAVRMVAIFVTSACVLGAWACDAPAPAAHRDESTPVGAADGGLPVRTCEGSSNIVDQAACPRLRADGCAAERLADTTELCRRLFVDLTGTAPSLDDVASTCTGKSVSDVVGALLATPAYVRHAEELWAEKLAYDPAQVDGLWLDDADRIVDELVTGGMGYDAFATRILGHPVFGVGARLPRSDVLEDDARFYPQVAARATQLFLGRAPIAGEDVSLAKLFGFWKKKIVVLNGDYGRAEPFLDPAACPCESDVFGATTRIELPLLAPAAYADLVDLTGSPRGGRPIRSPALRAELDKVGALLASRGPFWTQGADLALAMYLGWWKSTTSLDESVLPEVEVALAQQLRANRSWPELVRSIVTSTLYVRTNRSQDADVAKAAESAPPWCAGPNRILRPEAYVSSLGHLLDVRVGRCDHRTYEHGGIYYSDGSEGAFFPYALREDEPSDASALGTTEFHLEASASMGGCNAGAPRTEEPTLAYVFGAAPTAATVCEASVVLVPPPAADGSAADAARVGDHVSMLLRGRPTTVDEQHALAADAASSCAPSGCSTARLAAMACAAIARSLDFVTY